MFSIARLTAMKRCVSLPPIVWIGLVIMLSWQSLSAATLQGIAFEDWNDNGVWESCEPLLSDTNISIREGENTFFNTTTKDDGSYVSISHDPGDFTLWSDIPSGWTQTAPVRGESFVEHEITIVNSTDTLTVDFGFRNLSAEIRECGNPNITLTRPIHGATDIPISGQVFTWEPDPEASAHRIVISTRSDFAGFTDTGSSGYCNDTMTCLTAANTGMQDYTVTLNLPENTTFYWKVRASKNPTFWSEVYSFTTGVAPKTGCNGDTQLPDDLCNGLTLYMPFDGNANDASGNRNDGTVNGATLTTDRHGIADSAYSFDDDYIEVPDSNGLDFTNEFTIGVWVNPEVQSDDIPTNGGIIISKEASYEFALTAGNSKIRYALKNSSSWKWMNTGIVAPLNQWTFLTMSYDGSLFKLYKDGILEYQRSESGNISPTDAPLGVGARYGGPLIDYPSYWVSRFNGLIDDMSLYRRTLTDAEVQNLYDSNKPATTGCNGDTQLPDDLCNGLVAYYPLDSNPNDASGNGNDGTEHNVNYGTGVVGNALDLDGTGYIRKENFNFTAQDFSVATWMKASSLPDYYRHLFAIHSGGGGTGHGDKAIHLYHHRSGNAIRGVLTTEDGQGVGNEANYVTAITNSNIQANQWYHIAFVRQSSSGLQKLYVNGINVDTITERNVAAQFFVENGFLEIGAPNYYQGGWTTNGRDKAKWQGLLDEVYLYNRELTDSEVQSLYNMASLEPQLVAHYCFDDPDNLGKNCSSDQYHGSSVGGVTSTTDGKVGKAALFDGDYDYINISSLKPDFMANAFTLVSWFKINEIKSIQSVIWFQDGQPGMGVKQEDVYFAYKGNTSKPPFAIEERFLGSTAINTDAWNCAAYTYDAADNHTINRFLNGTKVMQKMLDRNFIPSTTGTARIGLDDSSARNFNGLIDEVRIYNYALSDEDIQSLCPTPPSAAVMVLEDAEDGNTDDWSVYSKEDDWDAAFANVFDSNKNSQVIEFTGHYGAGYQLSFDNNTNFIARWSMKTITNSRYVIYWRVKTNGSVIYVSYRNDEPLGCHFTDNSTYVICGLDASIHDNTWHTITRDLEADLKSIAPNLELQEVEYLKIRMAGRIDDIQLLNRNDVNFHTISGTITDNGQSVSGESLSNTGADCQPSDSQGDFTCIVPEGWYGSLMPKNTNEHYFVPFRIYNKVSENLTGQDFTVRLIEDGLFEDAEDGDTDGWSIYENTKGDAAFSNVVESETNSRVIELTGDSSSGYLFAFPKPFSTTRFIAQWRMKMTTTDHQPVYWRVKTSGSIVYLQYNPNYPEGCQQGGTYIICGLGENMPANQWHTITRDLKADLKSIKPDLELQQVEYLNIRMAGQIDDIKLLDEMPTTDCNAVTEIPAAQCEALVALYDSTNGDNWTNNAGWNVTNTPCSWYGVTCENNEIVKLNLYNNQLKGVVPDLSAFTNLRILYLSSNQLSGNIPQLDALVNLQYLHLGDNQFTGHLPSLSTLTKLNEFYADNNQLSGTIPDLSNLTYIAYFHLKNNNLTGEIPDLSNLTKLSSIALEGNNLTGSIPDLSALTSLTSFGLTGNNQLCQNANADYAGHTEVDAFATCEFLDFFWLDSFALEESSEATGNFVLENGVSYLVQVKGTVSVNVWKTDWETDGYCGTPEDSPQYPSPNKQNGVVGLDNEYGFAGKTSQAWICGGDMPLDRAANKMSVDGGNTWFIPKSLDSAYNPDHVYTYKVTGQGNALKVQFADPYPNDNYGRFEIQVLPTTIDCNAVTEIPTAQCETLIALYDSTNGDNWTNNAGWNANNTLCTGWYNVACNNGHVTDIALGNNNLVGTIPDLSALIELETLVLGRNQGITGNFPDISQLSKLYHFSVGPSHLTGSLPANLVNASQLRELSITESELSGTLPDFSQLAHLTHLNLGQNQLTGEIPVLPSGLTLLNLADNNLCRNPNANYAGRPEVEAFPICPDVKLIAEASTVEACIGQDLTVTKVYSCFSKNGLFINKLRKIFWLIYLQVIDYINVYK